MITKDSQSGNPLRILHLLWSINAQYKEGRSVAEAPIHSVLLLEPTPIFCWVQPTWNEDYISQPFF